MKKFVFIFLLVYSQTLLSQDKYSRFIEKSTVVWAADFTDTFHFSNPNLSYLLRERLTKGEIKASIIENEFEKTVKNNVSADDIINRVAPNREKQITDDAGNIISTIKETENPLLSSHYFDSQTNNILELHQILYLQSGILKSYIPWVSPKYSVYTSWGEKLGIANAFSTGFKESRCIKKPIRKKAILLSSTSTTIILDTAVKMKMIKQLYANNLLQALWPYLAKKNYQIYLADSSIQIPVSKMTESLINPGVIQIPVYDSEGNISSQKITLQDHLLTPASFTSIELMQDWFYHAKSNTAFNKITHIILRAPKWNNGKKDDKESDILKIMLQ